MHKIGKTIRRRRKEGKTDYKSRLGLLKSNSPRFLVRKSNRYIIGQVIESESAQDRVIVSANSKELIAHGWPKEFEGSLKSIGAAYLTGFLLGKKSKAKNGIFDIGLQRNVKKSKLYAFLKGLIDAGIDIAYSEDSLPTDEIILKNEKTGKVVTNVKGKIQNGK